MVRATATSWLRHAERPLPGNLPCPRPGSEWSVGLWYCASLVVPATTCDSCADRLLAGGDAQCTGAVCPSTSVCTLIPNFQNLTGPYCVCPGTNAHFNSNGACFSGKLRPLRRDTNGLALHQCPPQPLLRMFRGRMSSMACCGFTVGCLSCIRSVHCNIEQQSMPDSKLPFRMA